MAKLCCCDYCTKRGNQKLGSEYLDMMYNPHYKARDGKWRCENTQKLIRKVSARYVARQFNNLSILSVDYCTGVCGVYLPEESKLARPSDSLLYSLISNADGMRPVGVVGRNLLSM